jgi:hypothetical protein
MMIIIVVIIIIIIMDLQKILFFLPAYKNLGENRAIIVGYK